MGRKAKYNPEKLVAMCGMGNIRQPFLRLMPWQVGSGGNPVILPRMGSITYGIQIGDSVYGMEGDHIEPGVSLKNPSPEENNALNLLSCIGNEAVVLTGEAKGEKGFVTGKHGGVEHLLVYFPQKTLEKMTLEDKVQIRMRGRGMKIKGFEESIHCIAMGPELFERLDMTVENGRLRVPVAAGIPSHLLGSGIGEFSSVCGDYDLMTSDPEEIRRLGLERLRYGDLVLLRDSDNRYGRTYRKGAVSIGVVVHGDSVLSGHGPGITTLLTCPLPLIEGVFSENANLASLMQIEERSDGQGRITQAVLQEG